MCPSTSSKIPHCPKFKELKMVFIMAQTGFQTLDDNIQLTSARYNNEEKHKIQ
jgi:hypothetical protein